MSKRPPPVEVAPTASTRKKRAFKRSPLRSPLLSAGAGSPPPSNETPLAKRKRMPPMSDGKPSQNPESGISFGYQAKAYAPDYRASGLQSFGSTPTPNGPVPSSSTLVLSSERSSASLLPIPMHSVFDTKLTSTEPSNANFQYAGPTSNSVPVMSNPPLSLPPLPWPLQVMQELQELSQLPWSPSDLIPDAPALPFSPPPQSDTNTDAPAPANDRSVQPFSRSSPLCLDGQISDRSKYVVSSGGYADIWTGSFDNKIVAIKVMRPFSAFGSHIEISKILKRSWREYLAWSRLYHPNILVCLGFSYDFSPQTGQPSLVSPWMSNGTAIDYIKKRPNIDRVRIVVDIARGLAYLHDMNPTIVHGDLRAGNVLISDRGTACLADFGLSKILSDARVLTTSSEVAGSVRWMAPELLHESRQSVQSDVWAYGMTVIEIFTETRPYRETTIEASVLLKILQGELPPRPEDVLLITDYVWMLCQKCWQSLPEQRPSINEVLADIEGVRRRERLP